MWKPTGANTLCAKPAPILRVVLDTCVVKLATLPNPGNKAAIIWELCPREMLPIFGSPDTLSEYHRVLAEQPLFLEEIQAGIELCYPFCNVSTRKGSSRKVRAG